MQEAKIIKIGPHLPKLSQKDYLSVFMTHSVNYKAQQNQLLMHIKYINTNFCSISKGKTQIEKQSPATEKWHSAKF